MEKGNPETENLRQAESIREQVKASLDKLKKKEPLNSPPDQPVHNPAWYELDRYIKVRDPLMVLGFILLIYGIALYNVALAFGVSGVGLIAISFLMSL